MGAALIVATLFCARKFDLKKTEKASAAERWAAFKDAVMGTFDAGYHPWRNLFRYFHTYRGCCCFGCIWIDHRHFVYKRLKISEIGQMIVTSGSQTGVVMYVIIAASLFAWVISVDGIATDIVY